MGDPDDRSMKRLVWESTDVENQPEVLLTLHTDVENQPEVLLTLHTPCVVFANIYTNQQMHIMRLNIIHNTTQHNTAFLHVLETRCHLTFRVPKVQRCVDITAATKCWKCQNYKITKLWTSEQTQDDAAVKSETFTQLTLRRLMSYIYIYIYIWSTHS